MTRRPSPTVLMVGVVVLAAILSSCGFRAQSADVATSTIFTVGDCVQIPSATPEAPARAAKSACTADPSYTVGATADANGNCPSNEYQHLSTQLAEPGTARLCLVPNLVAQHCYTMEMPIGVVQKADCAERGSELIVQITQRLDVRDQSACPAVAGSYAWPYPAPARTYCTQTLF
ncbi:hypothetical protein [Mycolicibacterium fluoranthenivorans]|jgi:hypothetical protein|uniref:Uncharacterized protein n=1 Tax=Mycolicibacterium fluoranthenivorans TaxID=258505 RepID=A0A1G4WS49_9MYCO|nr:hypothetical protein [Mycolicibacterium fluoranthenivorans]NIH98235.1 hypothetical protein [Mycolicibacterium fluoranthenivorans]SCX28526.1 hypothetical protein SAMN02799620_04567 [Mycolicibacterium fluoranthenivorans]